MSITALTTVFTPAPSCLASTNIWKITAANRHYMLLQGPPSTSDCLPTEYNPSTTAFYSPGICPRGYTPACSNINSSGTVTETTQTCCPSIGIFSCQTDPTSAWQSTMGCISAYSVPGTITMTTSQNKTTSRVAYAVGTNDGLNAYGIQIRFQASDVGMTSFISSALSTEITAQATSTKQPLSFHSSSGFNTGHIAAIVVGAIAGGIVLILLVIMAFWGGSRYSRRKVQRQFSTGSSQQQLIPENTLSFVPKAELDGRGAILEMEGASIPAPAKIHLRPFELAG